MRMPRRGERGFTLIELLIVVAILGVLAAVIIPNVGRFLGRGEEEARRTEFHNISASVTAMMVDNKLTLIPNPIAWTGAVDEAVNDMTKFPDSTSVAASEDKKTDPEGYAYEVVTDKPGYILNGHDITGAAAALPNPNQQDINYVNMSTTKLYYTCEADGTLRQWSSADTSVAANEYKY